MYQTTGSETIASHVPSLTAWLSLTVAAADNHTSAAVTFIYYCLVFFLIYASFPPPAP